MSEPTNVRAERPCSGPSSPTPIRRIVNEVLWPPGPPRDFDPEEGIACGACQGECPVAAIFHEDHVPDELREFIQLNAEMSKKTPSITERKNSAGGRVSAGSLARGIGFQPVMRTRRRRSPPDQKTAADVRLCLNCDKPLPDPEKLLRGSGKKTRWLPLEQATDLSRPAVARLIEAALAANPVPFPVSGRGPVVVRS